jgi:PAS domain S-box-containing protein
VTEDAQLSLTLLVVLLSLMGVAWALVGLLARSDLSGAIRPWSWAWAAFFLGAGFALSDRVDIHPISVALLGLPPFLLLAGSLSFAGRSVPPWVIALIPAGALIRLGVFVIGPTAVLPWSVVILATEGSAAVILFRGTGSASRLPERLLPFAMALFALAHTTVALSYTDRGMIQPWIAGLVAIAVLGPAQLLAVLDRMRDASERMERAHRESEGRFQSLANHTNLVVLILDSENRVVEWNQTCEAIYGWSRKEALGRDYMETFLPEEVRPAVQAEIDRIVAGGQAHGYENPVRTRQGERILRWNVTRLLDEAEQPEGILCLAEDVTDELKRRAEQRQLFAAVEQAGEAVTVADRRGIVVYANPAFCSMMEKDPSDVVGHPIRNVVYGLEDEQRVAEIAAAWGGGEIWKGRLATRWPDGRNFVRDATIAPVRDENGTLTHAVGVFRDVTREVELESELSQSQKLTALGTLAGGIAHDFNNLLTAVIGGAHLLLEESTPEETKQTAEEILEAAQRGASLSRQLLAFSRRQPLRPEVIDLDAVVAEMKEFIERLIGERIELTIESEDALWRVTAERSQVEQILMNLVLNARDAMPTGGRLTIRTANRAFVTDDPDRPTELAPGEYVSLSVCDTGTGMDEDTRSRAFEPFFTRKPPGAGTGLGLATVFGIARQSGGDVVLVSAPGQGSHVDVYLPRSFGSVAEQATPAHPVSLEGNETILLVEDEPMVRRIARRTLEELGYRVLEAEDGERARKRLEDTAVDLVVTDMVMPGISGPELVEELRHSHPEIRVLFISGYEGGPDSAPPSAPLLEKPFTPEQLAQKVREVLSGLRA